MIDRLLYAATAAALASVLVFDEIFSSNLTRAFGEPIATTPLNTWEVWGAGIFLVLAAVAIYRERGR